MRELKDKEGIESPISIAEVNKGKETTSWVMKTIIDNKDDKLFTAVKKYLSKPEVIYTEEKLK